MINHHACLYYSASLEVSPKIVAELTVEFEIEKFYLPTLTIADVRVIIDHAYQKPLAGEYKYIVINTNLIPVEAQNALLKILEEPPLSTRFLIILRTGVMLLPTLKSRLQLVEESDSTLMPTNVIFSEFLHLDLAARMDFIAKTSKNKDQVTWQNLYDGLLGFLNQSELNSVRLAIAKTLPYLSLRGASKKMLWEDIALYLPVGS